MTLNVQQHQHGDRTKMTTATQPASMDGQVARFGHTCNGPSGRAARRFIRASGIRRRQSIGILSALVSDAGTDYALLLTRRYREELHNHDS